jgi:hypothetical protein
MVFTIPLQSSTLLANVLWKWLVSGSFQAPSSSGVTQPDSNFPIFRIDTGGNPPTGAEEMMAYDSTDLTSWNTGGYRPGLAGLASAQQVLLVTLATPGSGIYTLAPAPSPQQSIARVYGNFLDLGINVVDGVTATFTLVQTSPTDPTVILDMSGTLIRNKETGQLISQRVITGNLVLGQLQDNNGNGYVSLTRTDYMLDQTGAVLPYMKYLLTFTQLGAQVGLFLLAASGPTSFSPVVFTLDQSNLMVSGQGTLDLSKLKPN